MRESVGFEWKRCFWRESVELIELEARNQIAFYN